MTDQHSPNAVAHHDPSDDDHGAAEPRLGPIDWPAWGYAIAGVAFGLLIVALLWLKVFTAG